MYWLHVSGVLPENVSGSDSDYKSCGLYADLCQSADHTV